MTHSAELGSSIPTHTRHAISVSLPLWQDSIDFELGLERVHKTLSTGYPRAYIHPDIRKLVEACRVIYEVAAREKCMLFSSEKAANQCLEFIAHQGPQQTISQHKRDNGCQVVSFAPNSRLFSPRMFLLVVPDDQSFSLARDFWKYTGLGISSRFAVRILRLLATHPLGENESIPSNPLCSNSKDSFPISMGFSDSTCHNLKQNSKLSFPIVRNLTDLGENNIAYLVRGRKSSFQEQQAHLAKVVLRSRIVDLLVDTLSRSPYDQNIKETHCAVKMLTESDVYLHPSGMSAIYSAHQLSMSLFTRLHPNSPLGKSICFGFSYADTLKMLEKCGPGAHFFGHGETSDLEALEKMLHHTQTVADPPIVALVCEFPSNPLLKSPDLARLRSLADQYGFLIIIDDTIGNFVNVDVLPYSDILVTSLTKSFSGDCTVMGGSMIVSPLSRYFMSLKGILDGDELDPTGVYEDIYFEEDAIQMEKNSRNVRERVTKINQNAAAICDFVKSLMESEKNKVIKSIHYPKYTTPENYERYRRKQPPGGYGGLFSIIFHDSNSCQTFYDNLNIYKGPSSGTNFSLACPYVILAHFHELEWVKQFGVDPNLIRVSVGLEDLDFILKCLKVAFDHANV